MIKSFINKKSNLAILIVAVTAIVLFVFNILPILNNGAKAGYSFQAAYNSGTQNADYSIGTGTASTDTALPALTSTNAYGGAGQSLSYGYDGTSTLKYPTASNLPVAKGSVEMKFQKSAYGNNVNQDTGSFNSQTGMDYDPVTGFMYIADTSNNRIVKTKIDGTGWQAYGHYGTGGVGQFNNPMDVDYDPATDYLYVMDYLNHRIVKTKMDGTGWSEVGSGQGSGTYQFSNPTGLYYNSNADEIYVFDCANGRIVRTNMAKTVWQTYGTGGSGTNQFTSSYCTYSNNHVPRRDLVFDSASGFIFVADSYNERVVRAKMDGSSWTVLTGFGGRPNSLVYDATSDPSHDGTGFVYINYTQNNQIVKTKMDNSIRTALGGLSTPSGIYYNSVDSSLYISDTGNHRIVKTPIEGPFTTTYGSYDSYMRLSTTIGGAWYDASSKMYYIADRDNHRIIRTGMDRTGWQTFGTYGNGVNQFYRPTDVAYDSATGFLYISDSCNGRIVKTKMDGTGWQTFDGLVSTSSCSDNVGYGYTKFRNMTYDQANGYLYIAPGKANSTIIKIKNDGTNRTNYSGYDTGGNGGVFYDAVSDYIYVSETYLNKITRVKTDGTGKESFGTSGSAQGNFNMPAGIAVDSSGYIYVADSGNRRIVKTTWNATEWATYGSGGSGQGGYGEMHSLQYDQSTGYLYVSDDGNKRVSRTNIGGTDWQVLQSTNSYNAKEKVLFSAQATDDMRLVYDVASRKLRFYLAYSNKAQFVETPTLNLTDGNWYTVKASFNKASHVVSIDLNGVNQATVTYDADWGNLSFGSNFYIGARNGSTTDRWDGLIDEVNIDTTSVDTVIPTNPTGGNTHFYDSSGKGTSFTSSAWGNSNNPYITWNGATDDASGIRGYWLYLGTSASANPTSTSGVLVTASAPLFQADTVGGVNPNTEQHFQVPTSALTNGTTYYFRIVTQDVDLNLASAQTNFTYSADSLVPTSNPTAVTSYSDSGKGTPITANTWYNYIHPYFEWTGATDAGGSDIAGYYTYFGADPNADVVASGTYSANANYTVNTSMTDGTSYYLRIRAKDNAGNLIATTDTDFTYRYTNTSPTTPLISGYDTVAKAHTAVTDNWYRYANPYFEWTASASTPGISGYYTYFGTDSNGAPASWQTGTNFTAPGTLASGSTYYLRLRAMDNANNLSDIVQFVYKFDDGNPSSNPVTFHGYSDSGKATAINSGDWHNYQTPYFEWDGATDEHSGVAGYYTYFGTEPTTDPSTVIPNHFQSEVTQAIDQALVTGKTYYFIIVTKNNAGGVTTPSTLFTYKYDTTAPSLPETVNVSPVGCSVTNDFTLTWSAVTDLPAADQTTSNSGFSKFQYKEGSLGQTHDTTDFTITVPPYQEGDNVFFLRSVDNAGNTSSWQTAIFCSTGVAGIIDGPTVVAGPSSVTVNWVSSKPTTSSVKVYDSNTYISEQGQTSYDVSHAVKVIGLKPEKPYRYQLTWSDQNGNIASSDWYTTQTDIVPQIINLKADIQNPATANLTWQTNYQATAKIEYGSGNYDTAITIDSASKDFSRLLSGLSGGTTYQLRVVATTPDGAEFSSGIVFSTPPVPLISNLKFQPITDQAQSAMKVTWTTNVETTSSVFFGPSGGVRKEISASDKVKEHELTIPSLDDNTEYQMYASGIDQYGNTATSNTNTFRTALDSRPPKITDLTIESKTGGVSDGGKAQIVVSWRTDELGTSQVEYGEGTSSENYSTKTQEDSSFANAHVVVISNLDPTKTYHLRAISKDKAGNPGMSDDNAVITGRAKQSALNLIIEAFRRAFSWIKLFQ